VSAVPQQESRRKRRRVSGPAIDQLSFLDLLYAVPVGDLATRVSTATPAQVSSADWSALAVIMATIVFSWIGLHKDRAARLDKSHRRGPIGDTKFWSLEFVQFLIEIVIVGVYFSMGLYLNLPAENKKATELPAEDWLTGLLLLIFILYLAWDLIDTRLARSGPWREPAWDGAVVTMKSLIPAAAIFIIVLITKPQTPVPVIILNAWLVILLYAYRFAQDTWGNCRPED